MGLACIRPALRAVEYMPHPEFVIPVTPSFSCSIEPCLRNIRLRSDRSPRSTTDCCNISLKPEPRFPPFPKVLKKFIPPSA